MAWALLRATNRSVPLGSSLTRRAIAHALDPVALLFSLEPPSVIRAKPGITTGSPGVGASNSSACPAGGVSTILPMLVEVSERNRLPSYHAWDSEVTPWMLSVPRGDSASSTSVAELRDQECQAAP